VGSAGNLLLCPFLEGEWQGSSMRESSLNYFSFSGAGGGHLRAQKAICERTKFRWIKGPLPFHAKAEGVGDKSAFDLWF